MVNVNVYELTELHKKEQELIARLSDLEKLSKELQNQPEKSSEKQAIEDQKASVQAELAITRSEMNKKLDEITMEIISKIGEQKQSQDIKLGRGEIDPNENAKTLLATKQEERKENVDAKFEIVKVILERIEEKLTELNQAKLITEKGIPEKNLENSKEINAASLDAAIVLAGVVYGANKIIKIGKEKLADKAVNDLDKNIANNEKDVNEKYNKEISDTEKYRQGQIAYTEKKYQDPDEKNKTIDKINDLAKKMNEATNNNRKTDPNVKQAEAERKLFSDTLEKTKNFEPHERQQEMEQIRQAIDKQRQLDLDRQRQLAEQNRNR